jgi:hypothetical protein
MTFSLQLSPRRRILSARARGIPLTPISGKPACRGTHAWRPILTLARLRRRDGYQRTPPDQVWASPRSSSWIAAGFRDRLTTRPPWRVDSCCEAIGGTNLDVSEPYDPRPLPGGKNDLMHR